MSGSNFNFGWNKRENNVAPWDGKVSQERVQDQKKYVDKQRDWMHSGFCNCDECLKINFVVNHVLKEIKALTRAVKKVARLNNMSPSAADILRNGGGGEGTLLHGSDVPKRTTNFTIEITGFREAPEGFKSLGIVDIKPVFDCTAWALNKTNFKALMNKFGDNTDKWKGKVKLQVIQVRNPSSGTTGPSLAVAP